MSDPSVLRPGATLGILGGGQLGRMIALAAAPLGLRCHIYDPATDAPAAEVAAGHTARPYDDAEALAAFAGAVDVVTYEFENVPVETARLLAQHVPVRPGARALEVSQDRAVEKTFIGEISIPTAGWHAVDGPADLATALAAFGGKGILKTRRMGYDGKGQARLSPGDDPAAAWEAIGRQPAVLEDIVPFVAETSVIVVRGLDGSVVSYEPGRNEHENGILRRTTVPPGLPAPVLEQAREIASRIATALDYVGVLGVELFVEADGGLRVNEIAPRVHNTGHWTMDACAVGQFENHVRAVMGWPLGATTRHADAEMTNLLGDEIAEDWARAAADPATLRYHHYGKREARPGRKMGHVNRLGPLTG